MIRPMLIAVLLGMSVATPAADDLRVSQLEQDVLDLQRQVRALSLQVESQRALLPPVEGAIRPRGAASAGISQAPPTSTTSAWVDAAKWERIKPGMSELEVIGILGPPTSMRTDEGKRVLLYALEIGGSGFLGGSITLRERSVISTQKPALQ